MAAAEVTITGILYDKVNRTSQNVVLIGEATFTGLGVGGGPMPPGGGGGSPPGIWGGGNVPMPTPPIANVPGAPGYPGGGGSPPGIWGPTDPRPTPPIHIPPTTLPDLPEHIWGPNDPRPTPPIYLPTPEPPEGSLIDWKVVWSPATGWIVVGVPNVPHPAPAE